GGAARAVALRTSMQRAREIAEQERGSDGGPLLQDPAFRRKAALLDIDIMAAAWLEKRLSSGKAVSESVGNSAASLKKLIASEAGQRVSELAMEALGHYGAPDQREALGQGTNEPPVGPEYAATPTAKFLNGRATTIFGGSSEVQRNILARVALGL
ncbi:MAG TPA: acyl-CoA dehydrogenase family protein, partial [Vulgatibacter sp.]